MRATDFINEAEFGTSPKRPTRKGSRPERGHTPIDRFKDDAIIKRGEELRQADKSADQDAKHYGQKEEIDTKPIMQGIYFYNVPEDQISTAKAIGLKQLKSGKIGLIIYDTSGSTSRSIKRKADVYFGKGTWWEPKKENIDLDERGKASRKLCIGSKPDTELGASQLASCKSQGLRARDGNKSHKLGKTKKSRVKVGGRRIKGKKYGGPLPDYGE